MKLLFNENVSPRLVHKLVGEFPWSTHVSSAALRGAEERQIWDFAQNEGYAIVSKDTDFRERSYVSESHQRSFGSTSATPTLKRFMSLKTPLALLS